MHKLFIQCILQITKLIHAKDKCVLIQSFQLKILKMQEKLKYIVL